MRAPVCAKNAAFLFLSVTTLACSAFESSSIPPPLPENPPFGQIIREIRLEGNRITRESVIRKTLDSKVGEPFTERTALEDYNSLFQLGVFTGVQLVTEPAEDGIVLVVTVNEVSQWLPSLSFLVTQENGLEIGPAIASPNLFGRATKASFSARFGGATNIGFVFADPWRRVENWYECCYEIALFHGERRNDLDSFQETSNDVFVQYLNSISDAVHVGPRFTYLGIKNDDAADSANVILDARGTDHIPGLGAVFEFDTRNVSIYPTLGWYVMVDALQHGGFLGGASDYLRTNVDVRRYLELAGPRRSLAFYSLLTVTTGDMEIDIPIHQDYHIGGTNSVRGWPLGSRRGKNQWLNTAEFWFMAIPRSAYRAAFFRFSMGLQLAAFFDVGTAWNDSEEFKRNWIAGGGLGARLIIPQVVMIRFDLAVGKLEPDFKLAFNFGFDEKAFAQKLRVR